MDLDLKTLINKLNLTCRKGLEEAANLCVTQTNYNVEIEHLLLKILDNEETDLHRILRYYEIDQDKVIRELTTAMETFKRGNSRTPALSPQITSLLQDSWVISSLHLGGAAIRSGPMVLAMLDDDELRGMLVDSCPVLLQLPRETLRKDLKELIKGTGEDANPAPPLSDSGVVQTREGNGTALVATETPALDQYTIDLTDQARKGNLDPIQGRDFEIRQIVDILMRRRQNNPILTGEAGVGKTAVVEGFALRVAHGDVPPQLQRIAIHTLDLGLLLAGAGVKGEFENRLKTVIAEVTGSPTPIILFIDEAHTMIGAGGPAGQGDAANLLKPALARGEMRTIAATTWSEYKKYIEKDPALVRRFQVVKVEEPDESKAIDMLRGTVETLERHHAVRILDEAVRSAVILSQRYISGRQLPDKAISVLDTACARVTIGQNSPPSELEDVTRRLDLLSIEMGILEREQNTGESHGDRLSQLAKEHEELEIQRQVLEDRWSQEQATFLRIRAVEQDLMDIVDDEIPGRNRLQAELRSLKEELAALQVRTLMVPVWVDARVVAAVISGWTGIPIGKMQTDDIRTVLTLQDQMAQRIIGQDHALDIICRRIRTSHADLDDPEKPVGVFLLVGPSGIGKTETALTLADLLYGGERNMVTINMSEYQEAHTVSGLKGAPPGYVGYGQGGVLTEAVRRNPYCVILLDEIEKAHPDVLELFYQVFDKGILEDGEGVQVDFKHAIILMTSNVGSATIQQACSNGTSSLDVDSLVSKIRPDLLECFKPAFLGRLVVAPYYTLGDHIIQNIVTLKLKKIQTRFQQHHQTALTYHDDLVQVITARCTEVDSGARVIDQILTQNLLPELSGKILERMADGDTITALHIAVDPSGGFIFKMA